MPPVVIGVAVAVAASAVVTIGTAVAIGMAAAALYSIATMKPPSVPGIDPQNAKQTIRSANEPFRGVYGDYVGSGPIIFAEEFVSRGGYTETYKRCQIRSDSPYFGQTVCTTHTRWVDTTKKWLHLVIPLAGHPIHAVEEVYFNDEVKSWDHEFWKITFIDGKHTSIEDLPLMLRQVPSWTDTMVGKGIAFLHVALRHSAKHFPNGIPNIKAKMKGAEVDTPFFKGFTNNAAAVVYDYLVNHFKFPEKSLPVDNFAEEYALCQEVMSGEVVNGVTRKRYCIDGGFSYDENHNQVLRKMLSACGGDLYHIHGKYYLKVGAYRGPVPQDQTIQLDALSGPISIMADTPLNERINKVTAQYLDAEREYQVNDMPPVLDQTLIAEDGEERVLDMDLEFVTSPYQAQRLAKMALKDNRMGLTLEVPLNFSGFKFNVGLPVKFNEPGLGYDELEFRVVKWTLSPDAGPTLVLKQTSPQVFDDSVATVSPKPVAPSLPDPRFCFPVENLMFTEFFGDSAYDGVLTWSHPDSENIARYDILIASEFGDVIRRSTSGELELRLSDLQGITYTISVTAVNIYRGVSEPVNLVRKIGTVSNILAVTIIPDNFSITLIPRVEEGAPSDLEFIFYRNTATPPSIEGMVFLGQGKSFSDVGRSPKTEYQYYIQPVTKASAGELAGPYAAQTTDDPSDIWEVIEGEIKGQYTWRVWALDGVGSGISLEFNPEVHRFMGLAYNKTTEQPTLNPEDYVFTRIADYISPEEQEVLDNLGQGKLPDGSGDLISADDVLFKPGDMVTETHIADDAISTPKLKANVVTADKVSANAIRAVHIQSGEIITRHLFAEAVTADKMAVNSIAARNIQAGAITADKIAVTVVEPINNFSNSGDLRGWSHTHTPIGMVSEVSLNGAVVRTLKAMSLNAAVRHTTERFSLENGAIYEVRSSLYNGQGSNLAQQALELRFYNLAGSLVSVTRVHPQTLENINQSNTPVLWQGFVRGWRHLKSYIVTDTASVQSAPLSANVDCIIKAPSSAVRCEAVLGMPATTSSVACHFFSPSVIKVGSGSIVAETIRANSEIIAPIIRGGTGTFDGEVTAGRLVGVVSAYAKTDSIFVTRPIAGLSSGRVSLGKVTVQRDPLKSQDLRFRVKWEGLSVAFKRRNTNNNDTYVVWDKLSRITSVGSGEASLGSSLIRNNNRSVLFINAQLWINQSVVSSASSPMRYDTSIINMVDKFDNLAYNWYMYAPENQEGTLLTRLGKGSGGVEYEVVLWIGLGPQSNLPVPQNPGGESYVEIQCAGVDVTTIFSDEVGHITFG